MGIKNGLRDHQFCPHKLSVEFKHTPGTAISRVILTFPFLSQRSLYRIHFSTGTGVVLFWSEIKLKVDLADPGLATLHPFFLELVPFPRANTNVIVPGWVGSTLENCIAGVHFKPSQHSQHSHTPSTTFC